MSSELTPPATKKADCHNILNSFKKKGLQFRLNLFTLSIDLMSIDKSFQSIEAMTEKALKPYVFKL